MLAVALALGDRRSCRHSRYRGRQRQRARPCRSREIDLGAERQQRRREVAAEGRETDAAALRRNVTDVAGGLKAMVIGGAPPFALVIEQAARVETEIAAYRPHVAVGGPAMWPQPAPARDNDRHLRMGGELGQSDRGTDLDRLRVDRSARSSSTG